MIKDDGLLIRGISKEDGGKYTCRARVAETGELEERDIKLEVRVLIFKYLIQRIINHFLN